MWEDGYRLVAGVDEVGRGALAGPVVVAAVILDPANIPDGIDDSKKLGPARRERLYAAILRSALATSFVYVAVAEIDALNVRRATLVGMARAIRALCLRPATALVDGRDIPPETPCLTQAIIGGDGLTLSVGAASIIAKVTRDRLMRALDAHAPGYGFARHVGYGTEAHRAALRRLGPSPYHRRSFRLGPTEA